MKETSVKVKLFGKNRRDRLTYGELYEAIGRKLRNRYPGLKVKRYENVACPDDARECQCISYEITSSHIIAKYNIFHPDEVAPVSKCELVGSKC